jgi:hypothetical protein
MISRILLAAAVALASVSTSDAFAAPGLALRGAAPRIGMSSAKSIRAKPTAPTMQVQELADATLLAASIWPQPMVDGITAYMNIYVRADPPLPLLLCKPLSSCKSRTCTP